MSIDDININEMRERFLITKFYTEVLGINGTVALRLANRLLKYRHSPQIPSNLGVKQFDLDVAYNLACGHSYNIAKKRAINIYNKYYKRQVPFDEIEKIKPFEFKEGDTINESGQLSTKSIDYGDIFHSAMKKLSGDALNVLLANIYLTKREHLFSASELKKYGYEKILKRAEKLKRTKQQLELKNRKHIASKLAGTATKGNNHYRYDKAIEKIQLVYNELAKAYKSQN